MPLLYTYVILGEEKDTGSEGFGNYCSRVFSAMPSTSRKIQELLSPPASNPFLSVKVSPEPAKPSCKLGRDTQSETTG